MNPIGAEKLRVSSKGLAAGKLALHEGQGFFRRADAAIARDFNPLMLLKSEKKLSRGVVILIASGEPNARSDFGLIESENAATVELPEYAPAERDIASHVGLGPDDLSRRVIHPDFCGNTRDCFLERRVRVEFRIGIQLNNVAQMAADRLLSDPFSQQAFFHAVDQFGAIFFLLLEFRIGSLGACIVGLQSEFERLFPKLKLLAVFCRVSRLSTVADQYLHGSCASWDNAVGTVFENLRGHTSCLIHLALDAFVLVKKLFVPVLVGNEFIGASLEFGVGRRLGLLGRWSETRRKHR